MTTRTRNLPLIRLSSINPFLIELQRRGVDTVHLLRSFELPDDVPASSELFVSPLVMYELAERCAEEADDRHLGFSVGQSLELLAWEPIARAVQEANSIGELLNFFVVYALDHSTATRFYVRTEGDRTAFGLRRTVEPRAAPAQNDALYVGVLSRLLMQATQDRWNVNHVLFEISDPDAVPATSARLRVAARDNDGIRISFPTSWLFEPFNRTSLGDVKSIPSAAPTPRTLIESLHVALKPHLHEPGLTVEKAAEICGYKKRRLSRELRAKGTTLAKEIAALRARRAEKVLIESDQRVAEIAQQVGFTDPTVFSRAFKNWTGQSPQEFRKTHKH